MLCDYSSPAGTKVYWCRQAGTRRQSSSEVRLWVLGATSIWATTPLGQGRWCIDEILVENTFRNPEGNELFLILLLDKVMSEPNITLLLNTAVYQVKKKDEQTISSVLAFCSQAQNEFELTAPLFCDTSGDGIVGFLAGAAFRMGAEGKEEFGEKFAPTKEYGELLGHSIYFYSKDTGVPVKFVPPSFALRISVRFRGTAVLIQRNMVVAFGGWSMEVGWIRFIRPKK